MDEQNIITVTQLMDESLLEKFLTFQNVRPRSVAAYRHNLRLFFNYLTAQRIVQPNREHVFAYRDALIAAGKKPATIRSYIIAVRLFFRWMANEGLYGNIAECVKVPGGDHVHRRDALTLCQVRAVLDNIDRSTLKGLRNYAIVALMVIGGLRCVEVSRARARNFIQRGSHAVLYVHGKGRGDDGAEYVKLSHNLQRALQAYLDERGSVAQDAPLFACTSNRNRNGPLSTRTISKIVKDALQDAGCRGTRLCAHSLRHTAVTLALKGGETLEAVKEFARHTSINTTLVYSHAIDRARSTCTGTIEKKIFGGRAGPAETSKNLDPH
ncbi:MAG: tyrosine-type recombinase/integrase [Fretibacterium sp.]|nr:tyrosine-type recombinase/integrase [Fretibacterium sp.]